MFRSCLFPQQHRQTRATCPCPTTTPFNATGHLSVLAFSLTGQRNRLCLKIPISPARCFFQRKRTLACSSPQLDRTTKPTLPRNPDFAGLLLFKPQQVCCAQVSSRNQPANRRMFRGSQLRRAQTLLNNRVLLPICQKASRFCETLCLPTCRLPLK